MSNSEIKKLTIQLEKGLLLAEKRMLQEKALHDQTIVVMGDDNTIKYIPAKEVIAEHAEFQ
ncbi:MAG: ribosome recycling factor [Prevotella sp.]|nr:ribosome recycling factor [Prevotella sp.]